MWEEDEKLDKLRVAIQVGEEQLERGGGLACSAERLDSITEMAFANASAGKQVNADVSP